MTTNDAVEQFITYISPGKSNNTLKLYRIGIARFCAHIQKIDVETITVDDVESFASAMKKDQLASSTRETYLTAVTLFVRRCVSKRIITFDAADVELLRELARTNRTRRKSLPHPALDEAVDALLQSAQDETLPTAPASVAEQARLRQLRNVALIHALRASGMRVGEVVKLTRGDLDKKGCSARAIGKGKKERLVYFDETAWDAIEQYLRERKDGALTRALSEQPLFARHSRTSAKRRLPLTTHQVQLIFADLSGRAQLDICVTPHMLRHAFAKRVLDATGNLAAVQDLMGHASPATTRRYVGLSDKRSREAYQAAYGKRKEE
ncbi:Tyrosine recombinase XerD [Anaerolineae bacterium]|nr:Tyrosine recombinase XerD [Anaerolineae bacterium]